MGRYVTIAQEHKMNRISLHRFLLIVVICVVVAMLIHSPLTSRVAALDPTPQPTLGTFTPITSSNATQLEVVAQMSLEPPFAMVNQIIWRQMREIEARTGYST